MGKEEISHCEAMGTPAKQGGMAMKPDIEKMAEETAAAYHEWLHGTRLKHSTPELARFIAKALRKSQGEKE